MERGEVYYLRYDTSVGHEMSVGRPVLVISADGLNKWSHVVTVAYMTTKYKNLNETVGVKVRTSGRWGWVLCNQLQTVDEERLDNIMCKLTSREMAEVDDVLRKVLSLQTGVEKVDGVDETGISVEDTEKTRLQIELDLYKKLYSDLTSQIVDARFERQVVVTEKVEMVPEVVEEKIVEVEVVEEPNAVEELNIDGLAKKMSTPNIELDESPRKKIGRPIGSKNKPKKANINKDSWETICEVTGMSDQTAKEIVKWRKKHGDFIDLDDLLFVPRFGNGCMSKYGPMLEA